jgi:hypothetical protein
MIVFFSPITRHGIFASISNIDIDTNINIKYVRAMNVCLMVKWIDKLKRCDNSVCSTILRNKYLGQKSIFQIKRKQGSQFWRSLLDMRDWYQKGIGVIVRSDQQTRFWLDCWIGECPLQITFNNLFQITTDIEVAKVFENGQWQIQFQKTIERCPH